MSKSPSKASIQPPNSPSTGISNKPMNKGNTTNGNNSNSNSTTPSYIWQWDLETVERWLRSLPLPKLEGNANLIYTMYILT